MAMTAAAASAIGPAYITPSIPINKGKIRISGSKNSTCLVSDTTIPSLAFPMDVKKPEDIGWIPLINVINIYILKYRISKRKYSSLPVPNILTICLGKNWKHKKNRIPTARE